MTRASRGKRPKLDIETKEFPKEDVKMEAYSDEDYDVKSTVKHKAPETSKKDVAVKRQKRNMCLYLKTIGGIILELPINTG